MAIIWLVVFALLGMAVGSFLNVLIDRLPARKSIFFPPSHCPSCEKRLQARDLIPIFSYLWLRGRCRYCGAHVPRRLLWVETISGALFPFLYWHFIILNNGSSAELAISLFYFSILVTILVIDLERGLILNKIIYPTMTVALLLSVFLSKLEIIPDVASAASGGGIGLGLFLLITIASRGGMGWGDVKLAALAGLITGLPLVFVAVMLAVLSGGLVAVILLILKVRSRQQTIPFGPFLSLATMATMLWGNSMLDWYLGLF